MALQKQVVPVPLAGGLDTKTDPKQLPPGKLLTAENVVMQRTGELKKVDGTTTLSTTVLGGSSVTSGKQLSVLGSELCLASQDGFYGYQSGQAAWKYRSPLSSCIVSTTPLTAGTGSLTSPVAAVAGNVAVYAWLDPSFNSSVGGILYTVVDLVSNSTIVPPTNILNSLSSPRAVTQGQYVFLTWLSNGGSIYCACLDSLNPTAFNPFALTPGSSSTGNYDTCAFQGGLALVHATIVGDLYGYIYSTSGSQIVGSTNLGVNVSTATNFAARPTVAPSISLFPGNSSATLGLLYYSGANPGFGLYHAALASNLTYYKTALLLDNYWAAPGGTLQSYIGNFSAVCYNGVSEIFYNHIDFSNAIPIPLYRSTVNLSTNTQATNTVMAGVALLTSRCFRVDNTTLMVASYETTDITNRFPADGYQTSSFVINAAGSVQGTILPGGKTGMVAHQFSTVAVLSSEKVLLPVLQKNRVTTLSGRLFTVDGVSSTTLDFSTSLFPPGQVLGNSLYFPGGYLKDYDGVGLVEAGFHLWPDLSFLSQTTGGSLTTGGSYYYRAVYEWRDANGQLHQSAASPAIQGFVTGSNTQITMRARALSFTEKRSENGRPDVAIVLYRTQNGGSTYYRLTSATSSQVLNTTSVRTAGYVDIADGASDSSISGSQVLYTTGGELDNINPPAPALVLSFKNRLFVVSNEDNSAVYFSKEIIQGAPPAFNDTLRIAVNPQYGAITGLGPLDDKLVILKPAAIYILSGDGPLPNGQQNTFSEAAKIASDVGCSNQASIVETPLGLMFQSAKGIYLLDRSLTVQYVGAAVESFNSLVVSGAFVLSYANQVRFTTTAGTTLVFDYIQQVWTVRTNEASVGSVAWNGQAAYLRSNGQVAVETSGQNNSDGAAVLTKIKTGFYSFAGLQGFQRVWRILVLGEFEGNHVLKVSIFTDYKQTADDSFYVAVGDSTFCSQASVLAVTTQAATFTGGASDTAYQFAVKPRVQKCEAMAVQIEDAFPTGTPTKGMNISSVSFEVGAKGTLKKLSASANMLKG